MVALLFLLDGSRLLSRPELAAAAAAAFACPVHAEARDCKADDGLVAGDPPSMVLAVRGRVILAHSLARPYFPEPEAALERSVDPALRRAIRLHNSWFSLDLVEGAPTLTPRLALVELARIAARLVASDTLAFGLPEAGRLAPAPPDLGRRLASTTVEDLLARLEPQPARVCEASEDLTAASDEARRRWPEFVSSFARRGEEHCFAVRSLAGWDHPHAGEWLFVSELHRDYLVTHRDPSAPRSEPIVLPVAWVADWIVHDGAGLRGAFATELVGRRLARRATGRG